MRQFARSIVVAASMLTLLGKPVLAQLKCETTNDPDEVQLISDDVLNFLKAIERIDSGENAEIALGEEYLDKASPGLREYLREHDLDAGQFAAAISKDPERYSALEKLPAQLASQEDEVRRAFHELNRIIPEVTFIPIYYLVGVQRGFFAEPSEYGLMIAISELAEDPSLVALGLVHETVHVQQALTVGIEEYMQVFGPKMSLLSLSLREGAAYFLTTLALNRQTLPEAYDYFIENEEALWEQFKSELGNRDPGEWLFRKPEDRNRPQDLGYLMGARIVESYYNQSSDKAQAITDILAIVDYPDFLKKSGYGN
ncbi:MAG: hypothetical protein JSU87_01205 [Gemmatimonadota bacterium]|nr:MAG: hypothetical protein JSU87_01205 [Gemmatimonadota bacterium]